MLVKITFSDEQQAERFRRAVTLEATHTSRRGATVSWTYPDALVFSLSAALPLAIRRYAAETLVELSPFAGSAVLDTGAEYILGYDRFGHFTITPEPVGATVVVSFRLNPVVRGGFSVMQVMQYIQNGFRCRDAGRYAVVRNAHQCGMVRMTTNLTPSQAIACLSNTGMAQTGITDMVTNVFSAEGTITGTAIGRYGMFKIDVHPTAPLPDIEPHPLLVAETARAKQAFSRFRIAGRKKRIGTLRFVTKLAERKNVLFRPNSPCGAGVFQVVGEVQKIGEHCLYKTGGCMSCNHPENVRARLDGGTAPLKAIKCAATKSWVFSSIDLKPGDLIMDCQAFEER